MQYRLEFYGPPNPGTTIRQGSGKLYFAAGHDQAAVEQMRTLFPERLAEAEAADDYVRLVSDVGRMIWESKAWDA